MSDANGWEPADYFALDAIGRARGARAEWIAGVCLYESALRPSAVHYARNRDGSLGPPDAKGLLQFQRRTLVGMGMGDLWPRFEHLSVREQLPAVDRFLADHRPSDGWASQARVYQAAYQPVTLERVRGWLDPIASRGSDAYELNALLDRDHDGAITLRDLDDVIETAKTTGDGPARWRAVLEGLRAARGGLDEPVETGSSPVAYAMPERHEGGALLAFAIACGAAAIALGRSTHRRRIAP
jgi:hypothetical protein